MNTSQAAVSPAFIEDDPTPATFDNDGVPTTATRYLFFPGDFIEPKRKRLVKRLRWGGEETTNDYKSFRVTRGMIWKYMFVPMSTGGGEFQDAAMISDEQASNPVTTYGAFGDPRQFYKLSKEPGDEIRGLLFGKSDLPTKGFVELPKATRGMEWAEFKKQGIQKFFFPEWEEFKNNPGTLPQQLSWAREQIQTAAKNTSETFFRDIADVCLTSMETWYAWGTEYLKRETTLVKTPPAPGSHFVYTYSGLSEQLFDQLEHQRDDFLRKDFGGNNLPYGTGTTDPEMQAMMKQMAENQALLTKLLAGQQSDNGIVALPEEIKEQITVSTPDTTLCLGTKRDGEPCSAPPKAGSKYCGWHQDQEPQGDGKSEESEE